jgi:hypothetical protein
MMGSKSTPSTNFARSKAVIDQWFSVSNLINIRTRVRLDAARVKKKADQASFKSLGHAGGTIRKTAYRRQPWIANGPGRNASDP